MAHGCGTGSDVRIFDSFREDPVRPEQDAEGAAAVHYVVEDALTGPHAGSWADLGLKPREGLEIVVMTPEEKHAFLHAGDRLREAGAEVSRQFYGKTDETA